MNNFEAGTARAILLPSFEASPAWNATFGVWRKPEYNFCAKALSHGFTRINTDTKTGKNLKTKETHRNEAGARGLDFGVL
jgi:hypothetical protein